MSLIPGRGGANLHKRHCCTRHGSHVYVVTVAQCGKLDVKRKKHTKLYVAENDPLLPPTFIFLMQKRDSDRCPSRSLAD